VLKFGVFDHLDDSGVPRGEQYANRLKVIQAYDANGIYGYHLAEHHCTPLGTGASPGIFLSAVAQLTRKLRFGPLVYLLPFYHPLRLIEEVCMLDQMSGGRFQLGVGRGVSPFEAAFYGIDFSTSQELYHEAYQVLMKGLQSEVLDFAGEHFNFSKIPMTLRPAQQPHPPLWYGLSVPENAAWPAQNDVNVIMLGLRPRIRILVERYKLERTMAGKSAMTTPLMGVSKHVVVADTDKEALAIARRAYPKWFESFKWLWYRNGVDVPPRVSENYPESFDGLMDIGNGIAGSSKTVRDFIRDEVDETGINYFVSWLAFGDMRPEESIRSVELLSSIMPQITMRSLEKAS